jgi:cell division control protein 6
MPEGNDPNPSDEGAAGPDTADGERSAHPPSPRADDATQGGSEDAHGTDSEGINGNDNDEEEPLAPAAEDSGIEGDDLDDSDPLSDAMSEAVQANEDRRSVFTKKKLVKSDTTVHSKRIVGRDDQLDDVMGAYSDYVTRDGPENLLLIGQSGTGKSLIAKAVAETAREMCANRDIELGVFDINCKNIPSRDRAVYKLFQSALEDSGPITTEESDRRAAEVLGKLPDDVTAEERRHYGLQDVPGRGVSTDEKYDALCDLVNWRYDAALFILDEVDRLEDPNETNQDEPAYSKLLYRLSRAGGRDEIEGQVSVTATTNVPKLLEQLDSRTDSTFNPKEVSFPNYDATDLREILAARKDAFREDALTEDVVPLCAAFGAQTHGDARRAIDLFRQSGEIADADRDHDIVLEEHVREAMEEIEKNRMKAYLRGVAQQKQLSLYSVAMVDYHSNRNLSGVPYPAAYQVYQYFIDQTDSDPVVSSSFTRYLGDFETAQIIEDTERVGRGKGRGAYKRGSLALETESLIETLHENSEIAKFAGADIGRTEGEEAPLVEKKVQTELDEFFKGRSLNS